MSNKKIIGTVLGVVAFIALIAGATFAWLTVNATVTNSYTGTTKTFVITYAKGNDIGTVSNGILQLKDPTPAQVTTGMATVTASKTANDAPASHFKLTFNISTNTFVSNSVIYAACKSTDCPSTALATVTSSSITCATGVTCGKITGGSLTAIDVLDDTTTFNTDSAVSTTSYNVYFWIDSELLSNDDMNVTNGAQIGGNISASAIQVG